MLLALIDDINLHRMRANSLALPGFLLDGANPDDAFGQWLDQNVNVSQQRQNSSECDALMGGKNAATNTKPKGRTKKDKNDLGGDGDASMVTAPRKQDHIESS